MEWGKNLDSLIERNEAGKPTPALDNMPELYDDLEEIWSMFWKLHSCRSSGFGINSLSISDIETIFNWYEIADDERLEYFELIKAMDAVVIDWANNRNEK